MNEYLDFAKKLAFEAGIIMKKYFMAGEIGIQIKDDRTPLTLADTEINTLVIIRVKERFPDHGVLGEEESYNLDKNELWVVDPLDGTSNFARGVPVFAFSIAFVVAGEAKVAVIYDPNTDRMTWAVKGGGAYENGKKLGLSTHKSNGNLIISSWVSGEGHQSCINNREIDGKFAYAYGQAGDILPFAMPIAQILPLVASSKYDAAVTSVKNPWDLAAGGLIALEAGAKVTDLFGEEIERWDRDIKGMIAASPAVHDKLSKIILPIMENFR